ncbi:MAG: hypothetical protein HY675_09190 [Chloroflexi bacterium]|nr:hypothetical protein [Chloroflexota bacterium]
MELVELHLNTLEEAGERERFFAEHNIKFYTDESPPSQVRPDLPLDESSFFQSHRVELPAAA